MTGPLPGKLGALAAGANKKKVAAAGIGVAALAALYLRSRSKKATAGATPAGGTAGATPATGGNPYNSIASDVYDSIMPQLAQLQGQISGLSASNPVASVPPPSSTGPVDPGYYSLSGPAAQALLGSNQPVYYQAPGGTYTDVRSSPQGLGALAPGTTLYQSAAEAAAWTAAHPHG